MTGWEAEPGTPYWWSVSGPSGWSDAPPARADILVIGAGYTGLSAAMTAHDSGASVVVIDAGVPGHGASTRNGGMVGAHPRLDWDDLAKRFGPDVADGVFAEAATALSWMRALIDRENIACDFQQTGRVQLAWTRGHLDSQKKLAQAIRGKSDVEVQVLDRDRLANEIKTGRYYGGLLFPEHGGLNPAKYHAGLANAVLTRGIPVVANCPARSWQRQGSSFVVQTPHGTIRADKLILATNGYTGATFPWHRRRVFPLPSYLIATKELPESLLGHLAPGGRMMVETRARHSYFRLSPDGKRILFGGRASMRRIPLDRAADRLHATMCQIWPELADVRLSHVWTGITGYSFAHMPHVGASDGLHHAMGFSGSGTVMAPYLGAKAAWQAVGDPRGETAYSGTVLGPRWFHRGHPWFLTPADLWYRFAVDPQENRASRP